MDKLQLNQQFKLLTEAVMERAVETVTSWPFGGHSSAVQIEFIFC